MVDVVIGSPEEAPKKRPLALHSAESKSKREKGNTQQRKASADSAAPTPGTTEARPVTILGLGSLLSERSSRVTFPNLNNFRLGRVRGYRRTFAHPANIFFDRGIANVDTKEVCSLSAESCAESSFICTVFEVPREGILTEGGEICGAFREREEEFELEFVSFQELEKQVQSEQESGKQHDHSDTTKPNQSQVPKAQLNEGKDKLSSNEKKSEDVGHGMGLLCLRSTDAAYIDLWGKDRFEEKYGAASEHKIGTIWGWAPDSGMRPCAAYLRHCVLAAKKLGPEAYASFLDDTYLIDRTTPIRQYLHDHPLVMTALPPPHLRERYGG